jgi:hypothetical protein
VAYASAGVALVVALAALGMSGHGLPALGMQLRSGQAWLSNLTNSSISFIDGYSGEVVSQVQVADATSQVVNTPDGAVVVGRNGHLIQVSNANFTTSVSVELLGGRSLTAAAGGTALYAINPASGQIQQLNPDEPSLPAIGAAISIGSPIVTPMGAPDGSLSAGVPRTGSGAHVRDGLLSFIRGVARPGDQMAVVLAGAQPAGADLTAGVIRPLGAAVAGPGVRLTASARPVSELVGSDSVNGLVGAVGPDSVLSIDLTTGAQASTPLPPGYTPTSAAMLGRNVVLIDSARRDVLLVNTVSHATRMLPMPGRQRPTQLTVQDGLVFVNAADGPDAMVINGAGQPKPVTKYTSPPPPSHPKPATLPAPSKPPVAAPRANPRPSRRPSGPPKRPGAPANPTAQPGNAMAMVSWGTPASGGTPTSYRVTWPGGPVGGETVNGVRAGGGLVVPTSLPVSGLANGSAYTFTIKAGNAVGWGPAVTTAPVTPSSTEPVQPANVTATATQDNGSVSLSWTEPNNGDSVQTWEVISAAGTLVPGLTFTSTSTGISTVIPGVVPNTSGTFGPVTFAVAAIDASRHVSLASPSNPVTPFLAPGTPAVDANNIQYSASGTSVTLSVSCGPACQRGDPVQSYTVDVGGITSPPTPAAPDGAATAVTVPGLTPNTNYVAIVTATDTAGDSTAASAAAAVPLATLGPPTVTAVTVSQATVAVGAGAAVDVAVTVNPGGELSTCTFSITVNGGGSSPPPPIPCGTTGVTQISVPDYNTAYTATVTASNTAGSSSVTSPAGTSSLKALTADASTAFGTCGNPPARYCGGNSHLQPQPGFQPTGGDPVVTQYSTVYASCQTTGSPGVSGTVAYTAPSYVWLRVSTPVGNGYMSNDYFPSPPTAASGLPGC